VLGVDRRHRRHLETVGAIHSQPQPLQQLQPSQSAPTLTAAQTLTCPGATRAVAARAALGMAHAINRCTDIIALVSNLAEIASIIILVFILAVALGPQSVAGAFVPDLTFRPRSVWRVAFGRHVPPSLDCLAGGLCGEVLVFCIHGARKLVGRLRAEAFVSRGALEPRRVGLFDFEIPRHDILTRGLTGSVLVLVGGAAVFRFAVAGTP
jgi:hypothetical protein